MHLEFKTNISHYEFFNNHLLKKQIVAKLNYMVFKKKYIQKIEANKQ